MHAIRIIIISLFLFGFTPSNDDHYQEYIIGEDNRELVPMNVTPWKYIGKVIASSRMDGGECSGTLVGKNLVLTAAHCLFSDAGFKARNVKFLLPDASMPKGFRSFNVTESHVPQAFNIRFSELSKRQSKWDWAILVLDQNIGDEIGFLPVENIENTLKIASDHPSLKKNIHNTQSNGGLTPNADEILGNPSGVGISQPLPSLTLGGYSADQKHVITAHKKCRFLRTGFENQLIYHECDAMPGDSGAPIMINRDGHYIVIGVFGSVVFSGTITQQRAKNGLAASREFVEKVRELSYDKDGKK